MTIFSKIIKGDIPCYKIAESADCFAFLDINPVKEGHCLVVSKQPVDYYYDLSPEQLCNINLFAQQVAQAIHTVIPCKKVASLVLGLEVPHAHMHLIPISTESDVNFHQPKLNLNAKQMEQIAINIRSAFASLYGSN